MPNLLDSVKDTLYNKISTVAVVSEDEFIITKDEICNFVEGEHVKAYALISGIRNLLHSDDVHRYDEAFDTERFMSLLHDKCNKICINPKFQLKINNEYRPYKFSIVYGESNAVFIIEAVDDYNDTMEEVASVAMKINVIDRIMKVNATSDTYEEVKAYEAGNTGKLSMWITNYLNHIVAENDKDNFIRHCSNIRPNTSVTYKRCISDAECRWTVMYLVPTGNYSEDNKEMIMYILDVHDIYNKALDNLNKLGFDKNRDPETGLKNLAALQDRISELRDNQHAALGYICVRNGTPDEFESHDDYVKTVVNEMIDMFSEDICYRISATEFVVLSVGSRRVISSIREFSNVSWGIAYSKIDGYGKLLYSAIKNSFNE